ncbi:hypothetical protein [Arcanobacterium ihumii]|nr:hypothetical protein [Arcanobacterium ihumii]
MRLQNPDKPKLIIVTLPEQTPVSEAKQLVSDLDRADVHPWAWVINNSLVAAKLKSSLLRHRAIAKHRAIESVVEASERYAIIQTFPKEPIGVAKLELFLGLK